MTVISVDGAGTFLGDAVESTALGGEYLGWTGFPGWQNQAEYLGIHHIRWPAGINAEDRIVRGGYAFDISTPTLVDNWPKCNGAPRDGLAEMFEHAYAEGSSFAMIVSTGRYVDLMATDPAAVDDANHDGPLVIEPAFDLPVSLATLAPALLQPDDLGLIGR